MRMPVLAAMLAACLAGCSVAASIGAAQVQVAAFHVKLNAGQFDAIYLASAPEMKKATTQAEWDQFAAAIHRKLGNLRTTSLIGENENMTTSGTFVTLNYNSTFDHGAGVENFVYRVDGAAPGLAGYHINSNALILN
jgi:hypothetical protein